MISSKPILPLFCAQEHGQQVCVAGVNLFNQLPVAQLFNTTESRADSSDAAHASRCGIDLVCNKPANTIGAAKEKHFQSPLCALTALDRIKDIGTCDPL